MDKKNKNIAIFGANGTIGSAMLAHYQNESQVYAFSRSDFDAK
jgi:dTDP-4-dehydrorhamnose reductase